MWDDRLPEGCFREWVAVNPRYEPSLSAFLKNVMVLSGCSLAKKLIGHQKERAKHQAYQHDFAVVRLSAL